MRLGFLISLVAGIGGMIGSWVDEWVDPDVVRFGDPALYSGFSWWPGKVFYPFFIIAVAITIAALFARQRKKRIVVGALLAVVGSFVFLILCPFVIRSTINELIAAGVLSPKTTLAMYYGYHFAFFGVAGMVGGLIWVLGAQPIVGPDDRVLRVALVWKDRLIKEETFTEKRDVLVGWGVASDFVLPKGAGVGKKTPIVKVDRKGNYTIGLSREMKGTVCIGGTTLPVAEYVKKRTSDVSGFNYVPIRPGDWVILQFGDVRLFSQFTRPHVAIGHKRAFSMDSNIIASIVGSMFVVLAFFLVSQFMWNPAGAVERSKSEKRYMKVEMNISQEKEEDLLEIGEEDDTVGKRAEGEEGKFGDPDVDPSIQSKVPKRDGQMVNRIDPKKIGLANVLANQLARSSAISAIMDSNVAAFDNRMAVAMAGTGSELVVGYGAGGMGFKGTGPGGGGTGGYGRIHGLGRVDTGGGLGVRARLGRKRMRKVGVIKSGAMQGSGFCKRQDIMRRVMRKAPAIRACYEAQLQLNPKLRGKVTIRWTINLQGRVEGLSVVRSSLGNTAVERCVLRVLRHARFEKPEGGVCVVQWPFVFAPG